MMHQFKFRDGALYCEGVRLEELADRFGTPCYVYSAKTIVDNFRRLDAAFSWADHELCYAVKANSNLSILKLLADEGAGFDIVSGGELHRVVRAVGSAVRTTFAGVGKSVAEIGQALREGVYSFNIESEPELERIEAIAAGMGVRAPVAIRVNPDVDAGTHEFISTGKSHNKFGIGLDRAAAVYARAASCPHLQIRGVQTHIGSQILKTGPFVEAIGRVAALVDELRSTYPFEFFSIGGGVGIVYEDALASGEPDWWQSGPGSDFLTPETYASALRPALEPLRLRILLEPGRFIVGNAGVLLTTVEYVKRTPSRNFTLVDAAMNDLIRPALYSGHHQIVPLHEPVPGKGQTTDVVGPVCESGDFFAKDARLPGLKSGDRLALMSAGAYGSAMASNYNSRPLAPEILVSGSEAKCIRQRQTMEHLLELEMN